MLSLEYDVYRQEILDFLSTVTIKFDPFARHYERLCSAKYGISLRSDYENPYYLNMCGMYSILDTDMFVTAVEDGSKVKFDLNLKDNYPMTAALYKIPSEEYKVLCASHPEQTNLIKSIIYPVKDLDTAIQSDTFTLMAYDAGLLYPTERESIIGSLTKFLDYTAQRWYVPDFDYEDLFPAAFWSMVWSIMPTVCFMQRLKNLRTSNVHPMHVWEYLQSRGFGDYRDILTHEQSLFMYRNLMYLYQNKGKTSNLEILAENLLDELYVSLSGKNLYQEVAINADICETVPEVISENVVKRGAIFTTHDDDTITRTVSEDFSEFESMETVVHRMYASDIEIDASLKHITTTSDLMSLSRVNYLPTKLLEFKKFIIDARFLNFLIRFLFQTMCYKWSENRLTYRVVHRDNETNTTLDLSIGEAIALLNYAHQKSLGQDPIYIPTEITFTDPYREVKPDLSKDFITPITSERYPIVSLVDIDTMLSEIIWGSETFAYSQEFDVYAISQFKTAMKHIGAVDSSADMRYHDCMEFLYRYRLTVFETRKVAFTKYDRYEQFISTNESLTQMIDLIDSAPDTEFRYMVLFENLLRSLIPLDHVDLKRFFGSSRDDTKYYRKMTALFTDMNSYNVTFLDTDRDTLEYIFSNPLVISTAGSSEYNCTTLPYGATISKYTPSEIVCDDTIKLGPEDMVEERIHEVTQDEILTGVPVDFCDIFDSSVLQLLDHCASVMYVETDLTRPLSNTSFKILNQ